VNSAIGIGNVLLRFGNNRETEDIIGDLSAVTFGPDGALWLASDELSDGRLTLSRLTSQSPGVFGEHRLYDVGDYIDLPDPANAAEADFEGLDYADGYLWFTGSHAARRARPKGKNPEKDIRRLATVEVQPNRFLLARIPLIDGQPTKRGAEPSRPSALRAARLADGEGGNALIEALLDDPHLGLFLSRASGKKDPGVPVASKENGFDVEGLAVFGPRIFLGLRGPVLRGWAVLLEIEPEETGGDTLGLAAIAAGGKRYRKHFLDLDGLGIRELSRDGDDLLILAGPTMALDGAQRLFRLRNLQALGEESVTGSADGPLVPLFELPAVRGADYAEGLAPIVWRGQPAVLVVYDGPSAGRRPTDGAVFGDVFWLAG